LEANDRAVRAERQLTNRADLAVGFLQQVAVGNLPDTDLSLVVRRILAWGAPTPCPRGDEHAVRTESPAVDREPPGVFQLRTGRLAGPGIDEPRHSRSV